MKSPGLRVLVVEDEPLIRWSIRETLAAAGHTVMEARDGAAAIDLLSDTAVSVDVVLLDLCLPDSRDLGLLAAVRRLSPNSRVFLMTADTLPAVLHDALALGARAVLAKPFDMESLAPLIQARPEVRGLTYGSSRPA